MPLPFSKSQVERLGERLIASVPPEQADMDQLHELLLAYDAVLTQCVALVRNGLGEEVTPRLKNTGTILEKLNRHGGSWLKSIQDLAGMRIVRDFNRTAQNELVNQIAKLFADGSRPPKVVDRRREPSNGYRAVHVIVYRDGMPVEIQVRTRWQHAWADLFEKWQISLAEIFVTESHQNIGGK
jgi:ppGpp synthetase/RelA/SpoT-type nucleotidyltranferase